jgi:hypothetical protein
MSAYERVQLGALLVLVLAHCLPAFNATSEDDRQSPAHEAAGDAACDGTYAWFHVCSCDALSL